MKPAEEFRRLVLEAVHRLRVDPHDEVTRRMLSDLFEERGLPESMERTVRPLREGKIVVNSLDVMAAKWLVWLALGSKFGRGRGHADRLSVLDDLLSIHYQTSAILEPGRHERLWTLAYRYRRQIEDLDVTAEAEVVHRERHELKTTRIYQGARDGGPSTERRLRTDPAVPEAI